MDPNNCFTNALQSCIEHRLEYEVLSAEQINARFPGYHVPPNFQVRLHNATRWCTITSFACWPLFFLLFPGRWAFTPGLVTTQALYQPQGGILASERCIAAHVEAALREGAVLHTEERMRSWHVLPSGLAEVRTDKGTYQAAKVVLTAGAWMPQHVPQLQVNFPWIPALAA